MTKDIARREITTGIVILATKANACMATTMFAPSRIWGCVHSATKGFALVEIILVHVMLATKVFVPMETLDTALMETMVVHVIWLTRAVYVPHVMKADVIMATMVPNNVSMATKVIVPLAIWVIVFIPTQAHVHNATKVNAPQVIMVFVLE